MASKTPFKAASDDESARLTVPTFHRKRRNSPSIIDKMPTLADEWSPMNKANPNDIGAMDHAKGMVAMPTRALLASTGAGYRSMPGVS